MVAHGAHFPEGIVRHLAQVARAHEKAAPAGQHVAVEVERGIESRAHEGGLAEQHAVFAPAFEHQVQRLVRQGLVLAVEGFHVLGGDGAEAGVGQGGQLQAQLLLADELPALAVLQGQAAVGNGYESVALGPLGAVVGRRRIAFEGRLVDEEGQHGQHGILEQVAQQFFHGVHPVAGSRCRMFTRPWASDHVLTPCRDWRAGCPSRISRRKRPPRRSAIAGRRGRRSRTARRRARGLSV